MTTNEETTVGLEIDTQGQDYPIKFLEVSFHLFNPELVLMELRGAVSARGNKVMLEDQHMPDVVVEAILKGLHKVCDALTKAAQLERGENHGSNRARH
jgi:hypothetical protein